MSYSYACRVVLSEISKILEDGEEDSWKEKAKAVQDKFRAYLWDDQKKACYARVIAPNEEVCLKNDEIVSVKKVDFKTI